MNHPMRMMVPVTDTTPTLIHVEGRPMAWLVGDRLFPYVAGGSDAPPADPPADDSPPADPPADDDKGSAKVEMTQAELDALIQKASGRAAKDAEKRLKDEADKASMGELEKAQAAKAEAEAAAAATADKANQRIVRSEAKLVGNSQGVDPARIDAFLRTVDLSSVEVDDDGEPDAKALAKVITAGLASIPEFKAAKGASRSGGAHSEPAEQGRAKDISSAVAARLAS